MLIKIINNIKIADKMHSFLILVFPTLLFSQIDYNKDFSKGRITWYSQSNYVACDIPQSEWPQYTAALSEKHFQNGIACGATARLRNGSNEIEVMIVDLCPVQGNEQWCSGDMTHFDLGNTSTFSQLEKVEKGVAEVEFKWIPTPVGDKPVKLRLKDGVNKYWVALQVLNHRYPISKLEVKNPLTGQWETGKKPKNMWNYWVFSYTGDGLTVPYYIRITDQFGQVIEETGNTLQEKAIWEGTNQFPVWGGTAVVDGKDTNKSKLSGGLGIIVSVNGNRIKSSYDGIRGMIIVDLKGRTVFNSLSGRQIGNTVLSGLKPGGYYAKFNLRDGSNRMVKLVKPE